jgi:CubicO group peptidase (beta-lactamase class C family)
VRHGWLVYERYFGRAGRDATPNTASSGKLFTSIAMGILMGEHPELFPDGLDQKVYTPRYLPSEALPPNEPAKSEIKLGQLLSMTAGLAGNCPGSVRGKDVELNPPGLDDAKAMFDANAFGERLWCKPGEGYSYATTAPHIVSIIVRQLTGVEMQQYLDERVAKPLGWGRWGLAIDGRACSTPREAAASRCGPPTCCVPGTSCYTMGSGHVGRSCPLITCASVPSPRPTIRTSPTACKRN